jgi:glycosyltransferase involved in cell wall biosynthesis
MLSVNILCWNTWPILHKTLHVLAEELRGVDSEVIIVDNGSTDECKDAATIRNEVNLGISKGKNQGIDASRGEYILLLDGDIVPPKNSIRSLLAYLETHSEVDALGFHPNKWQNQVDGPQERVCNELVDVRPHKGHACYFGIYRRSVFDRGVRFDEAYGPGYGWEDLDMYMQMEKLGIKQYFAHINHTGGRYFHAINSSIRVMGDQEYVRTSTERGKYFKHKWELTTVRQS